MNQDNEYIYVPENKSFDIDAIYKNAFDRRDYYGPLCMNHTFRMSGNPNLKYKDYIPVLMPKGIDYFLKTGKYCLRFEECDKNLTGFKRILQEIRICWERVMGFNIADLYIEPNITDYQTSSEDWKQLEERDLQ